jgi:hypothetical protein
MSTAEDPVPRRSPALAILGTLLHGILAAGLLVFFIKGVPAAKKTFDEYGMTLPLITLSVIRVSNWMADLWWAVVPLVPFAAVGDFLLLRFADRRLSVWWFVAVTVVLFVLLAVAIGAIELSMMQLRAALK